MQNPDHSHLRGGGAGNSDLPELSQQRNSGAPIVLNWVSPNPSSDRRVLLVAEYGPYRFEIWTYSSEEPALRPQNWAAGWRHRLRVKQTYPHPDTERPCSVIYFRAVGRTREEAMQEASSIAHMWRSFVYREHDRIAGEDYLLLTGEAERRRESDLDRIQRLLAVMNIPRSAQDVWLTTENSNLGMTPQQAIDLGHSRVVVQVLEDMLVGQPS